MDVEHVEDGTGLVITNKGNYIQNDEGSTQSKDSQVNVNNHSWIWEQLVWKKDVREITQNGGNEIWFISDGSFKEGVGTSATIFGYGKKILGYCTSITPGTTSQQSPFRSELAGIAAGVMIYKHVCELLNKNIKVSFGLDGLQAIRAIQQSYINVDQADFDLIMFIKENLEATNQNVNWIWIKGHQDDLRSYSELSWNAKMNIEADRLANRKCKVLLQNRYRPRTTYVEHKAALQIRENYTTSLNLNKLYEEVSGQELEAFWIKRNNWTNEVAQEIAWDAFGQSFQSSKRTTQRRVLRLSSGYAPTHDNMFKWKKIDHDQCPGCGTSPENNYHLFHCSKTKPVRKSIIIAHKDKLMAIMDEPMADLIIDLLQGMGRHQVVRGMGHWTQRIRLLIAIQSQVGWENFAFGWVVQGWSAFLHQQSKQGFDIPKNKRLQKLIHILWEITRQLWDL